MHGGAVAYEDGEVNYDFGLHGAVSPLESQNPAPVHNYEMKVSGEAVSFVQKRPRHEGTPDVPPGLRRRRTYMSLVGISERWWELGDARTRARALRSLMAAIRSRYGQAPLGFAERWLAPIWHMAPSSSSPQTRDSIGVEAWVQNTAEEVLNLWHTTEGDISVLGGLHPAAGVGHVDPPEPEEESGGGSVASSSGLMAKSAGCPPGFLAATAHIWPDGSFSTREQLIDMGRWDLVARYEATRGVVVDPLRLCTSFGGCGAGDGMDEYAEGEPGSASVSHGCGGEGAPAELDAGEGRGPAMEGDGEEEGDGLEDLEEEARRDEHDDSSLMDRGERRQPRGRSRSRSRSRGRLPRSSQAAPKARNENCREDEASRPHSGTARGSDSGAGSSTDRRGRWTAERVQLPPGLAPVRQGGDHVRRTPPPPGTDPPNIDFTIFPAPPTSTDQAVDIWRHLLGTGAWGEDSSPPVRRGGPYIPDARAEYMNAVLTSYSVEAQAIMTLGLITAVRAMLTELGQICHGASLVEVQCEAGDEEGDGTLMVQASLVIHGKHQAASEKVAGREQDEEIVYLMQGKMTRSFALVQKLQADLENAQPGIARCRALHLLGRLAECKGRRISGEGQELLMQVEAVCVAISGSVENEVASGFAAHPGEIQQWSDRWWEAVQMAGCGPLVDSAASSGPLTVCSSADPAVIDELANDEAAERRDREALEHQQELYEKEEQEYEDHMVAMAEEVEEKAKAEACRAWDDWALWDEMHAPRRARRRPFVEIEGEGAVVQGNTMRFRSSSSTSSGYVKLGIRFGMESSSSEAETIPARGSALVEQGVRGGHRPAPEHGVPLDFQGFQDVFDKWRAKQIGDEEVRQQYGDTTLELLQAQLWEVRDVKPAMESQNAEGLADTLLDVIVEEASVEMTVEGGTGVVAMGEQGSHEGAGGHDVGGAGHDGNAPCDPTGGVHCGDGGDIGCLGAAGAGGAREAEMEEVGSGGGEGVLEDTDEEEQEWRELVGARFAGGSVRRYGTRDRSD